MSATVSDVMTTQVIWVEEDTPFAAMAAALRQYRVSAFPVLEGKERVIGIVSEADMLAKEALSGGEDELPGMITGMLRHQERRKARGATAGEIMTAPAVTIPPDVSVEHAARLMYLHRVKRLPVVNADLHLVGIVTRSDVLSVFDRSDDEIRADVFAALSLGQGPAPQDTMSVGVKDGVVTLAGMAPAGHGRGELTHTTRHVQGVVAVRDRLTDPSDGPGYSDSPRGFPIS